MARHPKRILSVAGAVLSLTLIFLLRAVLQANGPVTQTPLPNTSSTITLPTTISTSSASAWFTVQRAVDGDTIELTGGTKVRYIGVNTPETHHPTKGVQCFGKEAAAFNGQLVAGKRVLLTKDVSETDRYGRLLRFVYLEDGTFINKFLLEKGYAEVLTYPPDISKSKEFLAVQSEARAARIGLWGVCSSTIF